jgi:hypothetical protein
MTDLFADEAKTGSIPLSRLFSSPFVPSNCFGEAKGAFKAIREGIAVGQMRENGGKNVARNTATASGKGKEVAGKGVLGPF